MATRTAQLIAKLTDQVSGPARGMAGALKSTASALDALKAKAGQIDAFRQASKSLDDASQKLKLAQQNLRKVKADMEAAGDGGKKLSSALRSAEREVEAAKNAFRSQGQEVRNMRAALQEAGVPLNQLASHERTLRAEIDRTTNALKRQEAAAKAALRPGAAGRLGRLTDTIEAERLNRRQLQQGGGGGQVGGMLAGAGVARFGAAAAGIGGAAYVVGDQIRRAAGSAISFERSMIEVGKATDSSGAELDAYGERILKLTRDTGKTKEELSSILSSAGFAGRPKDELMDFTEYASKATVAWQTSAEETGQALAEIGNIYEANQKRIEEIGDAINTMADNSASRETDLLEFMRRAGASSRLAGISAEHMLAFGAAMKEVGVRNEVAATAFEALLNVMKLGEEFSKSAGKGLKELGVNSTKMRKAFVAKPVETMIGLLEKLDKVADPLKKAEIMTNLFGKEYQDDIAKLLNALPKLSQNLAMMSDKAKLAAGGVRSQFAQNLGKDVMKIDRATRAIDVLYTRLGDPIKVQMGGVAEQVNTLVDSLEKGDTILQRLVKRLTGGEAGKLIELPELNGEGSLERWFEEKLPWLSGKKWNDELDKWIGKTGADTDRMNREDAEAKRAAERQAIFDAPGDIERKIQRQREAQDQSRREAATSSGMRRSTAIEQVGRSDAEIKRLEGELAKAWEAIGEMRARDKRERGAFGLDGPTGKGGAIEPGSFGFGLHGTQNLAPRSVPLPPGRPNEFGKSIPEAPAPVMPPPVAPPAPPASTPDAPKIEEATRALAAYKSELAGVRSQLAGLEASGEAAFSPDTAGLEARKTELEGLVDATKAKIEALNSQTIRPQADVSGLQPLSTEAEAVKGKLAEVGGYHVAPTGDASGLRTITTEANAAAAALQRLIALGGQAEAAGRRASAALANVGGGARTGRVAQTFSNSPSAGEA